MSWAEEDWTVGLSGRVLQKVKDLQVQQERLSRENKQKQLQLDNLYAGHEKQTVKYDAVRVELQSMQRELQSVRDEAKAAGTSCDRLTQELQIKQAQVCSLEGQLESARTLNSKLAQEVKRLEAELEKLLADTTVYSTPCWNTHSPWDHNGSRKEERVGQRDEGQSRALHVRRLQFSDMATASLPQQQYKSTSQSETSTPLPAFPWERDESRPAARRRSPSSPQTPLTHVVSQGQSEGVCERESDPRAETDKSLSEIRSHVSSLEEELSVKDTMLKATQGEMVQCKKELTAKELSLQKTQARITQESERALGAEQRLKQVQEELKCHRQNAESSRLQHQSRIKELEKQHQRDLMEFQKERQCMEKQHQQEMNKLNQELQQARTLHNALQAQADKLSLQKQMLEKELDTLKEKLQWTEKQLQESLKKEAQTQAKLMEAVREAEGVAVSLEQSKKRERTLEEEGKRLAEELNDAMQLIKELQEQKPAAPLQPVQFCPGGQSISSQPSYSYSTHSRPSSHATRQTSASRTEWKRDEGVEERRVEISASYPTDREPGEGIDSEHITVPTSLDSESFQKGKHQKRCNEDENKRRNDCESCGTDKHTMFDDVTPTSSAADTTANSSMSDPAKASEDFKRENAMLRSELCDLKEELQKRLEDLEAQRRAEAEARTRLKQLSRKRATQVVEKEEQEKVWRAQLESERAETERLKKSMAALQTEIKKSREDGEKKGREEQEEKNDELEERKSEMIELNIQLKTQLAEMKAQLAMEREERKREEEERLQMTIKDREQKEEFFMKVSELQAELQEVKRRRDLLEHDKASVPNSPLTYLTLHDDEFNSNIVDCDNDNMRLLCSSTNEHNTLISQVTAEDMQEHQLVTDPEGSTLSVEGQSGQQDMRNNCQEGCLLSDHKKVELAPFDLAKEVERLEKENAKEKERANQYQVKLEALQNQVTRQTQQLTMAFEKQSQHISGLLTELHEKESALVSQGEELQHHRQALDALKAKKEQEEREKSEVMDKEDQDEEQQRDKEDYDDDDDDDERSLTNSGLPPNQDKECAVLLADEDLNIQRKAGTLKTVASGPETPTSASCEAQSFGSEHSDTTDSDKTLSSSDSACVTGDNEWTQNGGTADVVAELLALQQENHLLKQRIETLTIPDNSKLALNKRQEILQDIGLEQVESIVQNERMMEGEQREDERTPRDEEGHEDESQLQIRHLEQQVVALRAKVWALTEQTQQQADELVVWRLAAQPAPTLETQDQFCAVPHSDQQPDGQAQQQLLGPQGDSGKMIVTREDDLFLSCSSNKLQGRMLFSRLEHINVSETKILYPSEKTCAVQQLDTGDKESEKENGVQRTILSEYTEKSDIGLIQISENIHQHQITKDLLEVSQACRAKSTEAQVLNQEVNPNISIQIVESSKTDISTEMKSIGSQTEESLCTHSGRAASELHCVFTQTEEEEEHMEDSPPLSPGPLSEAAEPGDKMLFASSFPIPADPARLAERIRRNRTQLSAAFDDTEYEPYGLPEVVMKGFADIPSGPSCPYIVRRGLLGTTVVPASQKEPEEEETD
ncbi:centromere protein F isoform X2 [Betta splendens]|nr:centromere protein F isoform X2 [Betta splendens]